MTPSDGSISTFWEAQKEKREKLRQRVYLRDDSWNSHCGSVVINLTSIHEDMDSIPGSTQWVKDPALL